MTDCALAAATWITAAAALLTAAAVIFQAIIFYRQTNIIDKQRELSERHEKRNTPHLEIFYKGTPIVEVCGSQLILEIETQIVNYSMRVNAIKEVRPLIDLGNKDIQRKERGDDLELIPAETVLPGRKFIPLIRCFVSNESKYKKLLDEIRKELKIAFIDVHGNQWVLTIYNTIVDTQPKPPMQPASCHSWIST